MFESNYSETCKQLPHRCNYIKYRHNYKFLGYDRYEGIFCKTEFDDNILRAFANAIDNCPLLQESIIDLTIRPPSKREIIDETFGVFKLPKYIKKSVLQFNLRLKDFKGFDIESLINVDNFETIRVYSDFNLYKKNSLVKSCQDFQKDSMGFIFRQSKKNNLNLLINKPKPVYSICSLFFRHANFQELYFYYLANTYFLNNSISFCDPTGNETKINLNSRISQLWILNSYNVNLHSRLLNKHVFASTKKFVFNLVSSIEETVFRSFSNLQEIYFSPLNLIQVIRKQGIGWTKNINVGMNFNLSNDTDIIRNFYRQVRIMLYFDRQFILNPKSQFAKDKDFCLFVEFPFRQMVFIFQSTEIIDNSKQLAYSCTELWIFHYYPYFKSIGLGDFCPIDKKVFKANFTQCNFKKRIELCNKTQFEINKITKTKFTSVDLILISELISIILTYLLAIFAIFVNLITIYIIYHKDNKNTTRDKHFIYMSLHCVSNSIISFVQLVGLMSECQYPIGIFCSSIQQIEAIQYVKIILVDYLNSVCRLVSNFTYLGFTLCRMSKVGKDHGKLIVFIANLNIKIYMAVCILMSAGFSVCKALQYDINFDMPTYAYPVAFVQNSKRFWFLKSGYIAITAMNAVYDLINYLVFVLVHLIVDLVLIRKLKRVLKEKENKLKEMKSQVLEKTKKENKESKRQAILMVVFNSIFNVITKIPSLITSLNDVRLIINNPIAVFHNEWFVINHTSLLFSFSYFCLNQKSCVLFQRYGNCLFLFSLCSTLFFLKRFDKNFANAYQLAFTKKN